MCHNHWSSVPNMENVRHLKIRERSVLVTGRELSRCSSPSQGLPAGDDLVPTHQAGPVAQPREHLGSLANILFHMNPNLPFLKIQFIKE